jgi:hypothetical protein
MVLSIGPSSRSAIGTLVERRSHYILLVHLPAGDSAGQCARARAADQGRGWLSTIGSSSCSPKGRLSPAPGGDAPHLVRQDSTMGVDKADHAGPHTAGAWPSLGYACHEAAGAGSLRSAAN